MPTNKYISHPSAKKLLLAADRRYYRKPQQIKTENKRPCGAQPQLIHVGIFNWLMFY